MLRESEDRAARGEYTSPSYYLAIFIGLRDMPGVRGALSKALAENIPRIGLLPAAVEL
jgi:hypothetical protein